jgi:hypothetical protein
VSAILFVHKEHLGHPEKRGPIELKMWGAAAWNMTDPAEQHEQAIVTKSRVK